MSNIILDLYRTEGSIFESIHGIGPEYKTAMGKIVDQQDKFVSMLTDEQKKEFEKIKDSFYDISTIDGERDFLAGFRIGARFMIAALMDN